MATKNVFYSFHFDNDVFKVQQIRNIGSIEENEPVSANEWEKIKNAGKASIEKWIENTMKKVDCVIVLVGIETYKRPWVKYEIEKAWNDGKGLLGIYIHNINWNGKSAKGMNPFEQISLTNGKKLSDVVTCYDPKSSDAYNDIASNIDSWVENAIKQRK